MAFYTGSVAAKNLFTTIMNAITAIQPGETASWWKKESSLDADGVYTSTGSTGVERIVLVFRENTIGMQFSVGMAREYTPGAINTAGAFDTLQVSSILYFNAVQDPNVIVSYDVSVTKDRVIIHVQGDKLVNGWKNTVTYLGMPIRYDMTDKKCVIRAQSENEGTAYANGPAVLEDGLKNTLAAYVWFTSAAPGGPSWGNTIFLEVMQFGKGAEGFRGELDGLYAIHPNGVADGDETEINGVRYKAIVVSGNSAGNNSFPRTTLMMRKL